MKLVEPRQNSPTHLDANSTRCRGCHQGGLQEANAVSCFHASVSWPSFELRIPGEPVVAASFACGMKHEQCAENFARILVVDTDEAIRGPSPDLVVEFSGKANLEVERNVSSVPRRTRSGASIADVSWSGKTTMTSGRTPASMFFRRSATGLPQRGATIAGRQHSDESHRSMSVSVAVVEGAMSNRRRPHLIASAASCVAASSGIKGSLHRSS